MIDCDYMHISTFVYKKLCINRIDITKHLNGKNFLWSSLCIYNSVVNNNHFICISCGQIQMVQRKQSRKLFFLGDFFQKVHKLELLVQVKCAGRFIHHDYLGILYQRLCNEHQLALSTG